jgi:outer membrane murein-binding lipoprotein Lpp
MKTLLRAAGLAVLTIAVIGSAFSCSSSGGVSQQDYDQLKSQLDEANSRITALQSQLTEALAKQLDYERLSNSFDGLKAQNDANVQRITVLEGQALSLESQVAAVTGEKQIVQASYDDLQIRYQDLLRKYQALTLPSQPITESAVEKAIFDLINVERANHGLTPLGWGTNMYQIARQNSIYMSELGRYEYAQWNYFQQLFWAAGYGSVPDIARGAMLIWTNNQYQYEHGMLSTNFKYCAIGSFKQGDVIYITSMMSDFP